MKIAMENKAKLIPLNDLGRPMVQESFDVQFNPEQYSKSWDLTWHEVGQTLQWTKTTPATFTVTLHFDSYEDEQKDVSVKSKGVRALLDPSKKRGYGFLFQWGKSVFKGVVKSVKEDFTLFLADGTPVRSVLTVNLQPWPCDLQDPPG